MAGEKNKKGKEFLKGIHQFLYPDIPKDAPYEEQSLMATEQAIEQTPLMGAGMGALPKASTGMIRNRVKNFLQDLVDSPASATSRDVGLIKLLKENRQIPEELADAIINKISGKVMVK